MASAKMGVTGKRVKERGKRAKERGKRKRERPRCGILASATARRREEGDISKTYIGGISTRQGGERRAFRGYAGPCEAGRLKRTVTGHVV